MPLQDITLIDAKKAMKRTKNEKNRRLGLNVAHIRGLEEKGAYMVYELTEAEWREVVVVREWAKSAIVPKYKQESD